MSLNTAIRPGFPWAAEIEFPGETFPPAANFRSQFRASREAAALLDITSITRLSATLLRVDLTREQTAGLQPGRLFFDIARTDLAVADLLTAEFEVDVRLSITRGI